ncbi:Spy/CpxP family protein refolding chaperone [Echinicola marina]|uniref:Spy/CpxP family protein refolding chaperone n=1 Tax=Echinicola marina TaxID=2859768 RepID=UPI001CF679B7|nr:Spy/CpxP family protein refolding chaperone [Echinicola marina]UCS93132.1 Spy/CpxP family protein refolding chaperone [Echinicola marina]
MKTLFILLISCITSLSALAQRDEGRRFDMEKFEAAKIAFLTQRLDISPEQATEFWPIYNQFDEKRKGVHMELRKAMHQKTENISPEKATELINKKFELQQELLDIEKKFSKQVLEVLSPVQVYRLGEIEREFLRHLYRSTRDGGRREPDGS